MTQTPSYFNSEQKRFVRKLSHQKVLNGPKLVELATWLKKAASYKQSGLRYGIPSSELHFTYRCDMLYIMNNIATLEAHMLLATVDPSIVKDVYDFMKCNETFTNRISSFQADVISYMALIQ